MSGIGKKALLFTCLACALALGAWGCSASVETSSSTEVSTTDENGTTTTTTTETSTTTSTESGTTTESSTETTTTVAMGDWVDAWMGTSSAGYSVYYAQAPDGAPQAMMALIKPDTGETLSFIGNYVVPETGVIEITDAGNGNTLRCTVTAQEGDNTTIDLGEELGTVDLTKLPMADMIAALKEADVNHQVLE